MKFSIDYNYHRASPKWWTTYIPISLFMFLISSDDIAAIPTAIACFLPSTPTTTYYPFFASIILPFSDVSPRHITSQLLRIGLIAPWSTNIVGKQRG